MKKRECQDCGDELAEGVNRRRCPKCLKLVCPWCWNHVHAMPCVPPDLHAPASQIGPPAESKT